jgi:hypothetical protein
VVELRDDVEENNVGELAMFEEVFEVVLRVGLSLLMVSDSVLLFDLDIESFFAFLLLRIFFICHIMFIEDYVSVHPPKKYKK